MADDIRKPDPDPTTLTTDALHREVQALRREFEAIIELKEETTKEKFKGIETQFALRNTAADKLVIADQKALAAALQAQKEEAAARNESNAAAIAKSEAGFTKQIDGIGALIHTMTSSFDDKLADLKSRMDRDDGRTHGVTDQRTDTRLNISTLIAVGGLLVALVFSLMRTGG
jgi:hypothetical protein